MKTEKKGGKLEEEKAYWREYCRFPNPKEEKKKEIREREKCTNLRFC